MTLILAVVAGIADWEPLAQGQQNPQLVSRRPVSPRRGASEQRAAGQRAAGHRALEFETRYGQVYLQRDSGPLKADIYIPNGDGPFPSVLVVHGGAWMMGTRAQLSGVAQQLASHGMTAVAISYRLAPKHKFPAQIEDCKAAVRWMREQATELKIDPLRLGGFGYSAGAQLVTLLGTTDPDDGLEGIDDPQTVPNTRLQAVVAGGVPCDFRVIDPDSRRLAFWLGGSRREVGELYRLASPRAFVSDDDPPMFFFHGENDELVPIVSAEAMCHSLKAAGVPAELYVVPKIGHNFAVMDRTAVTKSVKFLVETLGVDK